MNNHKIEHEVKLQIIIDKLTEGYFIVQFNPFDTTERPTINRKTLRELIAGALGISTQRIVNGWIDQLIGLRILEHNTTSEAIHGHIKPTNDSRYFININKLSVSHIDKISSKDTTTKNKLGPDST